MDSDSTDSDVQHDDLLGALVRHASTGIGSVDSTGRWRSWNRALVELLAREDRSLPDLAMLFGGRDRRTIERALGRLAGGERDSDVHDLTLKRPDGRTLQVRLDLCRIGDESTPGALLVLLEDITAALQIRRQLGTSESRMESVIRAMAEGVVMVDRGRGIRIANDRAAELLGVTRQRLLTSQLDDFELPFQDANGEPLSSDRFPVVQTLTTGVPQRDVTLGLFDGNRALRWLEMSTEPVHSGADGQLEAVVATFSDITRRYTAELKLRSSEERLSLAMSGAKLGFWDWDLQASLLSVSDSAAALLGFADDEVVESRDAFMELVHPEERDALSGRMREHLDAFKQDFDMDVRMQRKSGGYAWMNLRGRVVRWGDDDEPLRLAGTIMDIGDRKRLEGQLNELATTDGLTGADNRRHGQEQLDAALENAGRLAHPLGFVLLDIDHFKQVNDRFGHAVGDDVLKSIATLLRDRVRRTDTVARWGGEEFAVILPGTDAAGTVRFAEELRQAIRGLSTPDGTPITASLGAVGFRQGEASGELVKRADRLMYRAKQSGRDRVESGAD